MSAPVASMNFTINVAGFPTDGLPNEGYKVWLALVIMIICSGTMVCLRMAARLSTQQMGFDDYTIIAALMSCIAQTTLWALAVRAGYGADYLILDTYHRRLFNKYWFLGGCLYPLTIFLFKTSVLLLNKRIFVPKPFQIICWCTLVVNTSWFLGNWFGWIFQCKPISLMWGGSLTGSCFDEAGLWISIVAWDVSSDVWILSMVLPLVWKLNLKMREKTLLLGVFLLGAVVIVFSFMSCSAIITSLQAEDSQTNSYTFGLANLFQVLESNMGIIGACLPVMRQPLKQYLPRIFGTKSGSKGSKGCYSDDRFADQYVMQNVSNRAKEGPAAAWNSVSVSGPDYYKSSQNRKSDELGIINDAMDISDRDSGADADELSANSYRQHNAIRKKVTVSVDR